MIRNLQKKDTLQDITRNIMEVVSRVIKIQNTSNIYLAAFLYFVSFFCIVSILFLNNPLEPPEANQIFKFFVLSHLSSLTNVDSKIVLIVFFVFVLITNVLFVMNCFKTQFSFVLSLLGILISIAQVILVPISFFVLQNMVDIANSNYQSIGYLILKGLFSLFGTFTILQTLLFIYFDIRPLRDMNIMWNYENKILFYSNLINIVRAIVIYFDQMSVTLLTVSLIVEIHIYQAPSTFMYAKTELINKCRNLLVIFLHLSLIIGDVFQNKKLCFIFMSVSCVGCILIYVLDFISVTQSCDQIPKCCFQNSTQIYSFYIDYRQKNKNTNEELMRKISAHYLVCDEQNCIFKGVQESNSSKLSNQDLEQKISKFLKSFRYQTPQSQLLYQLWKIQLNKTVSLTHNLRIFSLSHKFVVNYVLGVEDSTKKDLTSTNNNASNDSLNQKNKFYKQLNCAIDQFQKMTEVMSKSLPQLNQVIDIVIGIHCQTQALTKLFEEMIKNKEVNYFCIELYLKFFQCFLDDSKLSNDIIDRLKRLKILSESDFIEQNPFPCFLVEAFSKNIEKVNAQGLKFLKAHRYEVKDKNFSNIVLPAFNLKQLYTYQNLNQKQDDIPVFFKIKSLKQTVMICRNIKLKRFQQNNKNYYEITVHKKNNAYNIIEILVDSNENMIGSTRNFLQLPYRDGKFETHPFEQVFLQHVKPLLKEISLTKIGRIQFGDRILISGLVMQKLCPHTDMRLITVNLIKKVTQTRNQKRISNIRLSKLYASQSKFSFYYKQGNQNKIILEGSQCKRGNEQSGINDTLEIRSINQKVSLLLANLAIPSRVNFSEGIKVYRLYNNDLYNIDLEDRARYEEQFSALESIQSARTLKFNVSQNVYIVLLVIFALLITGCSIFLNVTVDNQLAFISQEQAKLLKIQQFILNFNRILASLRDVANGLFQQHGRDYQAVIMDSYNELQSIDSSDFFSQQNYNGIYDGELYQGSLSELIEVSLAHVYEFIQVNDQTIIQLIHSFAIVQLGPKLSLEREYKKISIQNSSNSLQQYSLLCFIFIVSGSVLFYILFVLLSQKFKKNMDGFLQPLLITSQPQIKRIILECQKFKNVIVSLFKNYEVDLQTISTRRQKNPKRTRPKLTNFGFSSILTEFFFGGFVILTLICLALAQYTFTESSIKQAKKLFNEGEAVVEVYSGLCWVTNKIDHTGTIDYQKINSLSKYLSLIQNYKNRYQFSPKLSDLVNKVFFSDSCQYLQENKIISLGWCGDSFVGFSLQNPFKLSLDLYFRRMNYYLISNLTDSFASSGVYSDPFKQLFKHLAQQISNWTDEKIKETRSQLLILAIMVSAMSFSLIVILVVTIVYFRRKVETINNGLVSLGGENDKGQQKEEVKTSKEEIKQMDNSTSSNIMIGTTEQQVDQIRQQ